MLLANINFKNLLKFVIIGVCVSVVFMCKTDALTLNESIDYVAHYDSDVMNARNPEYPIHPLLLSRISAHEMTGEEISDDELFAMFEAARWTPSYYNIQPWNFVYAKRNTNLWQKLFDLQTPANQRLCNNSAALVIAVTNVYEIYKGDKRRNDYYSYDTGAAVLSLSLEATSRGYAAHQMGGFNMTTAAILMDIYDNSDYSIEVMIAIGKRPQTLPNRNLNETITPRIPVQSFVFDRVFKPRQIYTQ